jgi:hypothetical protein
LQMKRNRYVMTQDAHNANQVKSGPGKIEGIKKLHKLSKFGSVKIVRCIRRTKLRSGQVRQHAQNPHPSIEAYELSNGAAVSRRNLKDPGAEKAREQSASASPTGVRPFAVLRAELRGSWSLNHLVLENCREANRFGKTLIRCGI